VLIFYQEEKAPAGSQKPVHNISTSNNQINIYLSGGITMALALGIVAVSGIITYELEKNAPDVLGKYIPLIKNHKPHQKARQFLPGFSGVCRFTGLQQMF
jgi:hypothetical protein